MKLTNPFVAVLVAFLLQLPLTLQAVEPNTASPTAAKKDLPLPGEAFLVSGYTGFIIPCKIDPATKSKPWVWYAPTLPGLPGQEEKWMFDQFRDAGIAVAGIDVGESYGSPAGNALFTAFYREMTKSRDYSSKPVLLGRSRGGLMTLSWAVENPDKVAAFAGIYPVCKLASYPGLDIAAQAFGKTTEELRAELTQYNPVDRLPVLAKAGVPLFAIHGDIDRTVPLEANSGLMKQWYTTFGGSMQLIVPPDQGHNMWPGFFQCPELVTFVKTHAVSAPNLQSSQNAKEPTPLPQPTSRTARELEGWKILVDDRLMDTSNAAVASRALKYLEAKLVEIKAVVPAERVKDLQAVTIVLDLSCGKLNSMQYHPSAGWLTNNGYPAELAKCVHLPQAADVCTRRNINEQPWAILHELAHAYHDQRLGFDEPRIQAAYEQFKKSGHGDKTLLFNGKRVKHYALTDQKEFFAEMTEAYFGANDFFPFVRAELQEAEPELFILLTQIWNPKPQ
jgi:hypothetical protein